MYIQFEWNSLLLQGMSLEEIEDFYSSMKQSTDTKKSKFQDVWYVFIKINKKGILIFH